MAIFPRALVPRFVRDFFHEKFEHWLSHRIPTQQAHQLNSRNIMIYPTRFGLSYIAFVVLIFLLGTNYQNNIILLFSYLLASLFISVMLHSFYNFTSLQISSVAKQEGYAGQALYFPLNIKAKKVHFDINVHFTDKHLNSALEHVAQCQPGVQQSCLIYNATQRGKHHLGRVSVFSEYSLGLFKSKTVLDFGHYAIIYPKPKNLNAGQYSLSPQDDDSNTENEQAAHVDGSDDFFELRPFVQGESNARTAWKQLAKGQGHYSKHYQASQGSLQWLKLSDMPGNDLELKLSYLSFLVTELSASNQTFGLALWEDTAKNIEPDNGLQHQQACLTALALY